tara:strand:- start:164 stop:706 length:543 start_codon:yes stop_codon:yes gene_type:complete
MIGWILGPTASGKSTICYKVIKNLGDGYKCRVGKIPCWIYNDIMVLGRYDEAGYVLNGLDGVMVSKEEFVEFIDTQQSKYRHIIFEGYKTAFIKKEILDHLINYDLKIYYLKSPLDITTSRSKHRGNGFDKKLTMKRRLNQYVKLNEIISDPYYKDYIVKKDNLNMEQSNRIVDEIVNLL